MQCVEVEINMEGEKGGNQYFLILEGVESIATSSYFSGKFMHL